MGWLRASHRKLDPRRSLPYRPYHVHDERLWLKAGEPVECQVEIWPTSIVLKKGNRLRLDIQPRDGLNAAPYTHYHADYNDGQNKIYSGGDKESYLLVPMDQPGITVRPIMGNGADHAERRNLTVFFSDIKGFTGISEQLTASAIEIHGSDPCAIVR